MSVQVAANGFFSAALTEAGELYTWGSGKVSDPTAPPSFLLLLPCCV